MARTTDVITSIISGGKTSPENVTVDSTSWSTDNGTITLSASVPSTVSVGDVITDSAGNSYLITGISGSDLTCQDFDTTTDPATGSATIDGAYSSVTNWAADLDAGTNSEVYQSGDDATGRMFDSEGAFDESVNISLGDTVGLNSITLTSADTATDRHDGTAGSGARFVPTSSGQYLVHLTTNVDVSVTWIEADGNSNYSELILYDNVTTGAGAPTIQNCLSHDTSRSAGDRRGISVLSMAENNKTAVVTNNFIWNIGRDSGAGGAVSYGLDSGAGQHTDKTFKFHNNTVNNTDSPSNSNGVTAGFNTDESTSSFHLQNNVVVDTTNTGSGDASDYQGITDTTNVSNNASEDATAPGSDSITTADPTDFVSSTDLHLASGSVPEVDAGVDLVTTPTGVEIDIDGRDRDAQGDTWDMGADEFVSVAGSDTAKNLPLLGVG